MVKIPLPAGSYPTDEHEIINFRHWPGRKINRYGLHFDGVDDYVQANNVVTDKIFTIIIFFEKVLPFSSSEHLFDTRDNWFGSGGKGITIVRYADTEQYWVGIGDGTNNSWRGRFTAVDGKKFVVLRSDGNNLDVIVNQQLIDSRDISSYGSIYANDKMYFASNFGGGGNAKVNIYFSAFYNRALSDAEISQMYDYVMNGEGYLILDGLVLLLDFTEHGSNILYDKSDNGNHGTIYGATWLDEPSGKVDAFVPVVEG